MNPLRLYIKNRLEKLEKENEELKKCHLRHKIGVSYHEKLGIVFNKIIEDLGLQIEYIDSEKVYHVYSTRLGKRTIYTIRADEFTNRLYIQILLEILPIRRD